MKTKIILAIGAAVVACAPGLSSATPNLVTNGGFEDGFSGWTTSDFFNSDDYAHSGAHSAQTGCSGKACVSIPGAGAFLRQSIGTTAGATYSLSFWVLENGGPPASLSVFWDGERIATVQEPAPLGSDFVAYAFGKLTAHGASTTFELHGQQDAASIFFDDVAVVQTGGPTVPVPEPGSLALLGLGLAGCAAARKTGGVART